MRIIPKVTLGSVRLPLLFAATWLAVVAWPQKPPMTMTHPMYPVIEAPRDRTPPTIAIGLSRDAMDGYNLELSVRNFTFTPEHVDHENVPGEGHAHLYINDVKIGRLYSPWRHLPRKLFHDGMNRLRVVLNGNDHSSWGLGGEPISDEILIDTRQTTGDPIVRGAISYHLRWLWSEAVPHVSGSGWTATSDLGYEVHVTGGTLVTRSLELVTCHSQPEPTMALWRLLQPATVLAGHGSLLPDPSRITKSYTEDLSSPRDLDIEQRVVSVPEYCQGHYLIAREKGADLTGRTLVIEGSFRRGGDKDATPFQVRSGFAYGELKDLVTLEGSAAPVSMVGGIDVSVERRLGRIFDGVDFTAMNPDQRGRQILRSLFRATALVVR